MPPDYEKIVKTIKGMTIPQLNILSYMLAEHGIAVSFNQYLVGEPDAPSSPTTPSPSPPASVPTSLATNGVQDDDYNPEY